MNPIKKILFPTDFSDQSNRALDQAVSFARNFKAKLYVLHVVEQIFDITGFYTPTFPLNDVYAEMEAAAKKEIEKLSKTIEEPIEVENIVSSGNPFVEIINLAKDEAIDLIVIPTHGRTGLDHVLFGSVAEKVVRKAPCSVFVVKDPHKKFSML